MQESPDPNQPLQPSQPVPPSFYSPPYAAGPVLPPYPPPGPMPPQRLSPRQRFARLPMLGKLGIGCGGVVGLLLVCIVGLVILGTIVGPQPSASSTPTAVAQAPTQTQATPTATLQPTPTLILTPTPTFTPTPSPTPRPIYPPKTLADLHALAAKGDASAIHEFDSESVGLPVCPQPKREVTVSPNITGQQLAEDLLAYFFANGLDSPCGSVVFAYHSQSEAGNGYTAGRILVDTDDNSDPNATNIKHTLTLDIGDYISGQEYTITYSE